jgi:hypothetical protein
MMKDHEVNKLIESIQTRLDGGAGSLSEEVAAIEYARECREANERFDRIATVLASGGELEALQLAETAPRLIDRAVALSFGGEMEWADYCRKHGHEVAPPVDVAAMERLEEIYARGMSPKHPLYKKYRGAVLSRDEDKAYELIKLIAQLNPTDSNSQGELDRHEHKMVVRTLERLGKARKSDDAETMLECLTALENTGRAEEFQNDEGYQAAVARRGEIRRDAAQAQIPGLLDAVGAGLEEGGDWREAARIHAEIDAMLERHSIQLDAEAARRFEEGGAAIDGKRREAERLANVARLAEDLDRIAEDVETRSVTPDGLDPDFAAGALNRLQKTLRQMKALRSDLPGASRARVDAVRGQLEQVLERRRSRKKARVVTFSAIAVAVLLVASVFGVFAMRASERAKLLAKLRSEEQSSALAKQVDAIRSSEPILLRFPGVAAEVTKSEQWLKEFQGATDAVARQIDRLEQEVDDGFDGADPVDVFRRMKQAGELVGNLPPDLRKESEARLAIVRNEAERYLAACQKDAAGKAQAACDGVERNLDDVQTDGPAAAAKQIADECMESLKPFLAMAGRPDPILCLPAPLESRVADLDARARQLQEKAGKSLGAFAAVQSASSLAEYSAAIKLLAETGFREAAMARRVAEDLPNDRRLRAFIMFRGDLAALAAAEKSGGRDLIVPAAASRKDRDAIRNLSSNQCLAGLWEVVWMDRDGKERRALSRGALEERRLVDSGSEWKGKIAAYPKRIGAKLQFRTAAISTAAGLTPIRNKMTETSKLVDSLGLENILDATGTEFRKSIVPLVDRVLRNDSAPVMAKAYVVCALFEMLRNREYEWGLPLIPQLLADMRLAREIELDMPPKACDWLGTEETEWSSKWKKYFETRLQRHYYRDLQAMHSIVGKGLSDSILLAGVVTADRRVVAGPSEDARIVWGMCVDKEDNGKMQIFGETGRKGGEIALPGSVVPLSPVFAMEFPDDAERAFLLKIHGIQAGETAPDGQ